ncbi:uncharacterized protein LOC132193767 isoform X2 [Neocloeon triangulifer]|uniref:uncharacterized protein LOC132193767 isoform X2 n=1 Tax=Neocloeon triangulifer TaxID=2078957 RepID=UPI00286EC69B|nr:uncharacterized protein LOC132193767 isoform X2 [Neocloeon triangulifer]
MMFGNNYENNKSSTVLDGQKSMEVSEAGDTTLGDNSIISMMNNLSTDEAIDRLDEIASDLSSNSAQYDADELERYFLDDEKITPRKPLKRGIEKTPGIRELSILKNWSAPNLMKGGGEFEEDKITLILGVGFSVIDYAKTAVEMGYVSNEASSSDDEEETFYGKTASPCSNKSLVSWDSCKTMSPGPDPCELSEFKLLSMEREFETAKEEQKQVETEQNEAKILLSGKCGCGDPDSAYKKIDVSPSVEKLTKNEIDETEREEKICVPTEEIGQFLDLPEIIEENLADCGKKIHDFVDALIAEAKESLWRKDEEETFHGETAGQNLGWDTCKTKFAGPDPSKLSEFNKLFSIDEGKEFETDKEEQKQEETEQFEAQILLTGKGDCDEYDSADEKIIVSPSMKKLIGNEVEEFEKIRQDLPKVIDNNLVDPIVHDVVDGMISNIVETLCCKDKEKENDAVIPPADETDFWDKYMIIKSSLYHEICMLVKDVKELKMKSGKNEYLTAPFDDATLSRLERVVSLIDEPPNEESQAHCLDAQLGRATKRCPYTRDDIMHLRMVYNEAVKPSLSYDRDTLLDLKNSALSQRKPSLDEDRAKNVMLK